MDVPIKKWICNCCGKENRHNFCENCGEARPVKVYVGRHSLNIGDDANCPNMFNFYLPNDPADVVDAMYGQGLPIHTSWTGYLGKTAPSSCDEDGIQVWCKNSDEILFVINESQNPHHPSFTFTEGWYERIKAHPYIFCE